MDSKKRNIKSIMRVMKKVIPALLIILLIVVIVLKQQSEKHNTNQQVQDNKEQTTYPTANADQYKNTLVAESDKYELYLDGPTLSIRLKDKITGQVLESTVQQDDGKSNAQWQGFMKSGIALNVINGTNDTGQADLVNNKSVIVIDKIDNGFHAFVGFPEFDFSFEVNVTLQDDALTVEIPDKSIVEKSDKFYIGAINVFPFLGATYLGETEGYMFIPDGNGALINLNDKEGRITGGFSKMVYGDDIGFKESEVESLLWDQLQTVNDEESIMAPIFGMVHTKDQIGYLGIIESGEQRASIEAYPNGVTLDYNRIYAKFIMRKVYTQPTSQSNAGTIQQVEKDRTHTDIKVRYCLVGKDNSNYTGLAVKYRNYLLDNDSLEVKDNSYHTRIDFLGSEREDWLIFKRTVEMTSVDDIRNIFADLKKEGVNNVLSVYKGWQKGGLNQLPISNYNADGSVGGTSDLTKLIKEVENSGNKLYLYDDALRINPDENNTTFNVVKRVNKRLYEDYTYKEVYNKFLYLIPTKSSRNVSSLSKSLLAKGIDSVSVAGITNSLFSYSYSGNYYSRKDTMDAYLKAVNKLDTNFDLALEQPFSYLWNYTDSFLDMPIGTSNYNFADEEIPFLSIVLKGVVPMYSEYMNFEANKQEFFLKLIETGIYPSFYITNEDSAKLIYTNSADIYSSKYSIYKNDIIQYTKELQQINDKIKDAVIIGHDRLDNGVTVVNYNNGVNIYINYSDTDQTVDGNVVGAMSYKVGEVK